MRSNEQSHLAFLGLGVLHLLPQGLIGFPSSVKLQLQVGDHRILSLLNLFAGLYI